MPSKDGPPQNLPLCIGIMVFSGFLRVTATMTLAYPDHQARGSGGSIQSRKRCALIAIHVALLAVAAGLGILGTINGPVAIAVPVQTSSQLILNILAMGLILEMRTFNKMQHTGTCIIALSVLSLIDVGPSTQNGQNVPSLLSSPAAILWIMLVNVGLVFATIEAFGFFVIRRPRSNLLETLNEDRDRNTTVERADEAKYISLVLLMGVTLSNVTMATTGKCLGYLQGSALVMAVLYYLLSAFVGLFFSITSSTFCDQGLFTPACAASLMIVNMLTGIIIWEDWKVVHEWVGYFCSLSLTCCGVYLLADIDLLKEYHTLQFRQQLQQQSNESSSHTTVISLLLENTEEGSTQLLSQSEETSRDYQILDQDEVFAGRSGLSFSSSESEMAQ